MTTPDERLWFAMWQSAEDDCRRTKVAWMSARRRAMNMRKANRVLSRMADDTHHRLLRELDRNRDLTLRVYELERQVTRMRSERDGT